MTTIFPAPGTITSNNSYIVNWYIYDKPALRHPTVVKARTDNFVTVDSDAKAYNLETYTSDVYGEFKFDVILQSLEYATTNTNTAAWNTFDKPILSYTTTHATTITLHFVNRSYPTIPFKTGSTVRVSSKVSGYSKTFTVLAGKTNSITLNFDTIPPNSLVIDNINESVYYQSRFSLEPVASVPRTNLRYSAISPFYSPSIRIPDISVIQETNSNLKFFSVNTQTAIAVFKEVLAPRSADNVNKLKIDLKPTEFNTVPVTLSTYASDIAGQYKFNIVSQTPSYTTINTNVASWYIFDNNTLTYTTNVSTTTTIYFVNQNYMQFVPFPVNSTVRIKNQLTNYSITATVLKSTTISVTIAYVEFAPVGATIDNIYETVYYQTNIHNESNVSTSRLNLNYSINVPYKLPSIRIPEKEYIVPVDESKLKLTTVGKQAAMTVFKEVIVQRSADKVTNFKTEFKPVEFDNTPTTLPTYFSEYAGQYLFDIVNQTPSYLTVNTSTPTWYIFDKDILLYSTYTPTTSTIRFNNTTPFVPFAAGSTIRIKNKFSTYSATFTVLKSTATSVVITYTEFNPVGATIDNMYETVYYQSNTLRDFSSSSTAQRNFLKSITPTISPSITIPYAESFREVNLTISANTIQKPITVIKDVATTVKADTINKAKIQTAEIVTTVISNRLETHTAPVSGEYTYPVKSRNVDFETFNTSVVDWYIFDSLLTYDVRQATSITMYFDTPYYQQFIPFPTNSVVRISNKLWYSEFVTVLNGTTNSITINFIPNLPFNLYIDNIVETVYNQDHTYRNLSTVSDSRKKLFYSVMGGGLTNLPVDTVRISVDDKIVNSGNIAKQIANLSSVNTDISSADITKQLFKLSGDTDNLRLSNIDILKIKDTIQSTSIDNSHTLTHFDALVDGVVVQVDGQPIKYNVVNWYINESNILTKTYVLEPTTTLIFSTSSIWKLFLENQYVRIKQPAVNYTQDVLVVSSTIHSITFDTPAGFPTNYTGMTINHLYSPIYAQTLVDVTINPPNLTLPRENLAAASNSSFTSVFPYGKLGYNARGTNLFMTLSNDLTSGLEVSKSAKLNSYDSVKSGLSKYVLGQPVKYNVVNWYIKELDNRLTSTLTIGATTTINFENTTVLRPFLENQYVQIEQPLVGFKQDILVTSSTTTSITFNTVVGFPTNYTGMTISQLYSSVYPQSYVVTTVAPILPRENLYYMRLRSSTSLDAYFQQPVAVPQMASLSKQITAVKGDSGISNQRGSIDQLQINSVSNVDRSTNVNVLSNVTVLKPVITNTSLLVLKYLPTVVGEGNNQKSGVVNKFLVNRISEIGRETVITVPSTKISPIQFWN